MSDELPTEDEFQELADAIADWTADWPVQALAGALLGGAAAVLQMHEMSKEKFFEFCEIAWGAAKEE